MHIFVSHTTCLNCCCQESLGYALRGAMKWRLSDVLEGLGFFRNQGELVPAFRHGIYSKGGLQDGFSIC